MARARDSEPEGRGLKNDIFGGIGLRRVSRTRLRLWDMKQKRFGSSKHGGPELKTRAHTRTVPLRLKLVGAE